MRGRVTAVKWAGAYKLNSVYIIIMQLVESQKYSDDSKITDRTSHLLTSNDPENFIPSLCDRNGFARRNTINHDQPN